MSLPERIITFTASVITILNVIVSIPNVLFVSGKLPSFIVSFQEIQVSVRVFIVVVLECSLAFAFGWLAGMVTEKLEKSLLPWLAYIVISFFSALVSLFNIEQLLMGHIAKEIKDYIILFILLALAAIPACLFMYHHVAEKRVGRGYEMERGSIKIQIVAFIIIYISIFFRR